MKLVLETLEPDTYEGVNWASRHRYQVQLTRSGVGSGERVKAKKSMWLIPAAHDPWLAAHSEWHDLTPDEVPPAHQTYEFFPFFRALHLNAAHLREASERIDTGELASDGSNLPSLSLIHI